MEHDFSLLNRSPYEERFLFYADARQQEDA
jgi:hypothetical protein